MMKKMAYICSLGIDDEDEIRLWNELRDTKLSRHGIREANFEGYQRSIDQVRSRETDHRVVFADTIFQDYRGRSL